ncbi:MAG: hypothetical protein AAF184_02590 [Pseudomonadota bacterium]
MKGSDFEAALAEGKRNSLGRTVEVAEAVLADKRKLKALFACYASDDEWVRLRVSNALKRVIRTHPSWIDPWLDPLLNDVVTLDQPSAQWTVAQLCLENQDRLSPPHSARYARHVGPSGNSSDGMACVAIRSPSRNNDS